MCCTWPRPGLAEMRALIFELRPESLEAEGLVAALRSRQSPCGPATASRCDLSSATEPDVPLARQGGALPDRAGGAAQHRQARPRQHASALRLARERGRARAGSPRRRRGLRSRGRVPGPPGPALDARAHDRAGRHARDRECARSRHAHPGPRPARSSVPVDAAIRLHGRLCLAARRWRGRQGATLLPTLAGRPRCRDAVRIARTSSSSSPISSAGTTTGVHGNPLDLTPNFDRHGPARHARRRTRSRRQPVCAPARACLQTGLYPTTSGVYRNAPAAAAGHAEPWPTTSARPATTPATSASGIWPIAEPVPAGAARRLRVLAGREPRWSSPRTPTTRSLYDEDERGGAPAGLPRRRADRRRHPLRRRRTRTSRSSCSSRSWSRTTRTTVDAYPAPDGYAERYAGRWMPPDLAALGGSAHAAPGRLLGHGQAPGRSARPAARRAARAWRCSTTRSSSSPPTTAATSRPATASTSAPATMARSACRCAVQGPGFDGGGQVARAGQPRRPAADAAGRGRASPVPRDMQGRSILPLLRGGDAADWPRRGVHPDQRVAGGPGDPHRALEVLRRRRRTWTPGSTPASDRYVEESLYDLRSRSVRADQPGRDPAFREVADVLPGRLIERMVAAGETAPTIEPVTPRPPSERGVRPDEWIRHGVGSKSPHLP